MARLILIGAPGSGKSSIGKALARELGSSFEDTDATIVARAGKSIADIFASDGEACFRALEETVVQEAIASDVSIISLGGGSILDPIVQSEIAASDRKVIYLHVGIGNVLARIGAKGDRPLVAENPELQWREIMKQREPIYQSLADISIATDNKKPHEVAHELVLRMELTHE